MAYARAPALRTIERMKLLVLQQLQEFGSYHPTLLFSLGCLARLRQKRREYGKAERIYRRALELCGDAPTVQIHVVRMLLAGYISLLFETGRHRIARSMKSHSKTYLASLQAKRRPKWEWELDKNLGQN